MEKEQSLSNANKAMIVAEEKESAEGASSSSSVPPMPTGGDSGPYDVFLSFHGSDTRKEFTDHLYHRLYDTGLRVFRDRDGIPIGEEFSSLLLDAITQSKILIPVISENYASSKWCLHELVHIMKCKKSKSQIVLPIFHKVVPSDVRYLKGSFGKAFHDYLLKNRLDEEDILEGRQALEEVSYLNGWESEKVANGHEGDLVKLVVETVRSKLPKDFPLLVTKELVGLDGHMKKIMNWIDSASDNARMIGIFGMGGIGKTTLAKCIYNQLLNKFEHVSFLPVAQHHNINDLQSKLMSDILPSEKPVSTIDKRIHIIKSKCKEKKVLILLDDVDDKDQLNVLAGERNWFGSGSIIIVTTRNKAVVDQSKFEVDYEHTDYEHEMSDMDEVNSLILFNKHAFRMNHPSEELAKISHQIISTMGGLPLALEVIGSYLYKKSDGVWMDVLNKLKKQPYKNVRETLRLSYDKLEAEHKEIFLDIACFLIGSSSIYAMYMWDDCEFYPREGIEELKLRCLIKIEDDGVLRMHDQLRDLGRSIVCEEPLLEKRSRIWRSDEASEVLTEKKGSEAVQGICLDRYPEIYTNKQFKKLQKLRFLRLLGRIKLRGDFKELFSELRWLQWDNGTYVSFSPPNLHLSELVVLQLCGPDITKDWAGWRSIAEGKRLKVLELRYCRKLRCAPDFSALTELEVLRLHCCSKLKQVDPSIGKVKGLVFLDLSGCEGLKELPREVGKLENLEELILDSTNVTEIPTSIGSLWKLKKLSASNCRSLREIPNSIGDLRNLQHFDISNSNVEKLPNTIGRLKKLQMLNLRSCRNLKGEIPSEIGNLSSLEILDITDTAISDLPKNIGNLSSLQQLRQGGTHELQSLPELPCDLTHLTLSGQGPTLPQLSSLIHLEEVRISWTRST